MTEKIDVQSLDGLFDERSACEIHDINRVGLHLNPWRDHDWINASLRWCKGNWSINLEGEAKTHFNPEWGTGYGGIRFCRTCKKIDCIHVWDWTRTYRIERSAYCHDETVISQCKICKKRITRGTTVVYSSNEKACTLLAETIAEMGKPPLTFGNYPSGFHCELPTAVSMIFDRQGPEAARAFIRTQFGADGCQASFDMLERRSASAPTSQS